MQRKKPTIIEILAIKDLHFSNILERKQNKSFNLQKIYSDSFFNHPLSSLSMTSPFRGAYPISWPADSILILCWLHRGVPLSLSDQLRRRSQMKRIHLRVASHHGNRLLVSNTSWLFIATCGFKLLQHIPLDPWQDLNSRPLNL